MKIEVKNKLPITITIAIVVTSISTCAFASLSIHNGSSWILRILTQASLCLTMLLSGVNNFIYQKQKMLGFLLWSVSGFLLFVMIYTIYVGIQINGF